MQFLSLICSSIRLALPSPLPFVYPSISLLLPSFVPSIPNEWLAWSARLAGLAPSVD